MNVEQLIRTEINIPLKRRTIIHFMLVNNQLSKAIAKALKPYDISLQQFNVLRILRGQDGKASNLSTLNERMVTKMSNTTRLVDKLILKDYVHRIICPSNRRKVEITITKIGKIELAKMDEAVHNAEENILQNLSEKDLYQLNDLLNKF